MIPEKTELEPMWAVVASVPDGTQDAKALDVYFEPFRKTIEHWRGKCEGLLVTRIDQVAEMQMARIARLELRDVRVKLDKLRVKLKEQAALRVKRVDGTAKEIRDVLEAMEGTLLESEKFAERHAEEQRAKLLGERREAYKAASPEAVGVWPALADMTEAEFAQVCSDRADLYALRVRREKEAAEAAELARLEGIRERERLEEVAAEAKRRLEVERAAHAAREKELAAERQLARQAEERERAAERLEAERKLKAERAVAEKAAKEADEKLQAERKERVRLAEIQQQAAAAEAAAAEAARKAENAPYVARLLAHADMVEAAPAGSPDKILKLLTRMATALREEAAKF